MTGKSTQRINHRGADEQVYDSIGLTSGQNFDLVDSKVPSGLPPSPSSSPVYRSTVSQHALLPQLRDVGHCRAAEHRG